MPETELGSRGGASFMVQEKSTKKTAKKKKRQTKKPATLTVEEAVNAFVGEVDNLHKISIEKVDSNKYRVNVWICSRQPDKVCATHSITKSYFMKFSDGTLTDLTIAPKKDLNPW